LEGAFLRGALLPDPRAEGFRPTLAKKRLRAEPIDPGYTPYQAPLTLTIPSEKRSGKGPRGFEMSLLG